MSHVWGFLLVLVLVEASVFVGVAVSEAVLYWWGGTDTIYGKR